MTQKEEILKALAEGMILTPLNALQHCGTLRLSERIRELEAEGIPITHEMVKVGSKRVCSYRLAVAYG